jgi:hypothetical protein
VSPTLPLRTKCGIRVNKTLPKSTINKAIWWQTALTPVNYASKTPRFDAILALST